MGFNNPAKDIRKAALIAREALPNRGAFAQGGLSDQNPVGSGPNPVGSPNPMGVQSPRTLTPSGFYSQGAELANQLKQQRGSGEQMTAALIAAGVKPEEMKQSGVSAYARPDVPSAIGPLNKGQSYKTDLIGPLNNPTPLTKQQLAQQFYKGMPQIEETQLGNPDPDLIASPQEFNQLEHKINSGIQLTPHEMQLHANWERKQNGLPLRDDSRAGPPKFAQYSLPGGSNYRELLMKLPPSGQQPSFEQWYDKTHIAPLSKYSDNPQMMDIFRRKYEAERAQMPQEGNFTSSHWDQPNVLAHLRMNDRQGPEGQKLLHLEELQSDWGQKVRKSGTKEERDKLNADVTAAERRSLVAHQLNMPDEEKKKRLNEFNELNDKLNKYEKNGVAPPSAPFVTSTQGWTDLGLKRALIEAARGGYHGLTWTPGEEQAKRYDLSKHVDSVHYEPSHGQLIAFKDGNRVLDKDNIDAGQLPDIIGKEPAKKLLETEPRHHAQLAPKPLVMHTLTGQDLKVGGEGMKSYYDKIVPNRLMNIVKKLDPDARLGTQRVRVGGMTAQELAQHPQYEDMNSDLRNFVTDGGQFKSVPHLPITPKMRAAILAGLPQYKRGGRISENPTRIGKAGGGRLGGTTGLYADKQNMGRKHYDDGGGDGGDGGGGDGSGDGSGDGTGDGAAGSGTNGGVSGVSGTASPGAVGWGGPSGNSSTSSNSTGPAAAAGYGFGSGIGSAANAAASAGEAASVGASTNSGDTGYGFGNSNGQGGTNGYGVSGVNGGSSNSGSGGIGGVSTAGATGSNGGVNGVGGGAQGYGGSSGPGGYGSTTNAYGSNVGQPAGGFGNSTTAINSQNQVALNNAAGLYGVSAAIANTISPQLKAALSNGTAASQYGLDDAQIAALTHEAGLTGITGETISPGGVQGVGNPNMGFPSAGPGHVGPGGVGTAPFGPGGPGSIGNSSEDTVFGPRAGEALNNGQNDAAVRAAMAVDAKMGFKYGPGTGPQGQTMSAVQAEAYGENGTAPTSSVNDQAAANNYGQFGTGVNSGDYGQATFGQNPGNTQGLSATNAPGMNNAPSQQASSMSATTPGNGGFVAPGANPTGVANTGNTANMGNMGYNLPSGGPAPGADLGMEVNAQGVSNGPASGGAIGNHVQLNVVGHGGHARGGRTHRDMGGNLPQTINPSGQLTIADGGVVRNHNSQQPPPRNQNSTPSYDNSQQTYPRNEYESHGYTTDSLANEHRGGRIHRDVGGNTKALNEAIGNFSRQRLAALNAPMMSGSMSGSQNMNDYNNQQHQMMVSEPPSGAMSGSRPPLGGLTQTASQGQDLMDVGDRAYKNLWGNGDGNTSDGGRGPSGPVVGGSTAGAGNDNRGENSPPAINRNLLSGLMANIANTESRGWKNPYEALGPVVKSGDRAYGKYQVMGANVPVWTKEVLGESMTPAQFLKDSDAQEAVASTKLGQYIQQYGTPQDAASVWFSGHPLATGAHLSDGNMTGAEYSARAVQGLPSQQASISSGQRLQQLQAQQDSSVDSAPVQAQADGGMVQDPLSNLYNRVANMPAVQNGYASPQSLFAPDDSPQAMRGGRMYAPGGMVRPSGGMPGAMMNPQVMQALHFITQNGLGGHGNNGVNTAAMGMARGGRMHFAGGGGHQDTSSSSNNANGSQFTGLNNGLTPQGFTPSQVSAAYSALGQPDNQVAEQGYGSVGPAMALYINEHPGLGTTPSNPTTPSTPAPSAPTATPPSTYTPPTASPANTPTQTTSTPIGSAPAIPYIPGTNLTPSNNPAGNLANAVNTQGMPTNTNTLSQVLGTANPTMQQIFGFNYPKIPPPQPLPYSSPGGGGLASQFDQINGIAPTGGSPTLNSPGESSPGVLPPLIASGTVGNYSQYNPNQLSNSQIPFASPTGTAPNAPSSISPVVPPSTGPQQASPSFVPPVAMGSASGYSTPNQFAQPGPGIGLRRGGMVDRALSVARRARGR